MNTHIIIKNFLTAEECDNLLLRTEKYDKNRVSDKASHYRKCNLSWIPFRKEVDEWSEFVDNIVDVCKDANKNVFNLEMNYEPNAFQITTYDHPGDNYKWHADRYHGNKKQLENNPRQLTMVITLTDAGKDYTGKGFDLTGFKEYPDMKIRKEYGNAGNYFEQNSVLSKDDRDAMRVKGTMIIFPSTYIHTAYPVESGSRRVLVSWLT